MRRSSERIAASNRLSHGLTSAAVSQTRHTEVKELALALVPDRPLAPEVRQAAEDLADAILALHAIRRAKTDLLSQQYVAKVSDAETLLDLITHLNNGGSPESDFFQAAYEHYEERGGLQELLRRMARHSRALRRFDEYERKAHSRYRKCVMRLDHAVIEERRRRGKMSAAKKDTQEPVLQRLEGGNARKTRRKDNQ
jgi:hypothetical protein